MSAPSLAGRPVRVVIQEIGITAASAIDARRVAERLPAALERELARLRASAPSSTRRNEHAAERAASGIVREIEARLWKASS